MDVKRAIGLILTVLLLLPSFALAYDGPYASYLYDASAASVLSPQIYLPASTLTGTQLGTTALKAPQDVFCGPDGKTYIADTGNGRIVVLDGELRFEKEIKAIGDTALIEPMGLFVTKDKIYIADKRSAVYITDLEGALLQKIETPVHPLIPEGFLFAPIKLAADRAGRVYVLSYACYTGILQFSAQGDFLGYYGANKVEITPEVYLDYLWKQILSQEQRENMMRLLPVEYSNLTLDPDEFIYTTTISASTLSYQIKKLNPVGNNVLVGRSGNEIIYGDLEYDMNQDKQVHSAFVDVAVDVSGLIYGLDRTRMRVFVYDPEGNLIGTFGGKGYQKGTFQSPAAVEICGDKVLVLDATKNNLTVFEPTAYMEAIQEGMALYQLGRYDEALLPWQEVSRRNSNNLIAQSGIGKALTRQEAFSEALDAFQLGDDRYNYSNTYREYRLENMRGALPIIALGVLGMAALLGAASAFKKRRAKRRQKG